MTATTNDRIDHEWIEDPGAFDEALADLSTADRYAVDTEFHRERTYFPRLALIQIAWGERVVLVDPLAVDIAPLADVLRGPGLAVMHAAGQDLEVLERACGTAPARLFDTQVAAGFIGLTTPSLATLCDRMLRTRLPKGDRLTDWLARPLGEAQRRYAASDVAYLLQIHQMLHDDLVARGRFEWASDEFDALLARPRGGVEPDQAWLRIKEARHLRGRARGIASELAAWRERVAAATDQPVRFVLSDLGLVAVAQRAPEDRGALSGLRGVDGRHLRGGADREILEAVERGRAVDPASLEMAKAPVTALDPALRPAVTLVSAWVSQLARNEEIDPVVLATRSDIEAFLRDEDESRLSSGWRHDLLGDPIRRLVKGQAALAFDGRGGLVLEDRIGHEQ